MPGINVSPAQRVPSVPSFAAAADDDDFGEFAFASSVADPKDQTQEDDEWGEFVATPLGSHDPVSSPSAPWPDDRLRIGDPPPPKAWEKPRGALPLSIFGEEDADEEEGGEDQHPQPSIPPILGKGGFVAPPVAADPCATNGGDLKNLVVGLYGEAYGGDLVNGGKDLHTANGNADADDDSWEFRDACSQNDAFQVNGGFVAPPLAASPSAPSGGGLTNLVASLYCEAYGGDLANGGKDLHTANGDADADDNAWEFRDARSQNDGFQVKGGFVAPPVAASPSAPSGGGLTNLVASLYGEAYGGDLANGGNDLHAANGDADQDVEEDAWEFRDACLQNDGFQVKGGFVAPPVAASPSAPSGSGLTNLVASLYGESYGGDLANGGKDLHAANGDVDHDVDEDEWEFRDACSKNDGFQGGEIKPDVNRDAFLGMPNSCGSGLNGFASFTNSCGADRSTHLATVSNDFFEDTYRKGFESSSFSSNPIVNDTISKLYANTTEINSFYLAQGLTENGHMSATSSLPVVLNDDEASEENEWEFQAASETLDSDQSTEAVNRLQHQIGDDLTLDIYQRLRDCLLRLAVCHLENFKKVHESALLSVEEIEDMENKEQMVNKRLQEQGGMTEYHVWEHKAKDCCMHKLHEIVKEPKLLPFEQEYRLSQSLPLVKRDFNETIKLLDHATSVSHILSLASSKEQQTCVMSWHQMALACSQELRHGASILRESLEGNVCNHIFSRASRYFLSLGEVYRVVEVLRISSRLYKPWILIHPEGLSRSLEECVEIWSSSGLGKALKDVSEIANTERKHEIEVLLRSIQSIRDFDEADFLAGLLDPRQGICVLSLLPLAAFPGMRFCVWDGNKYFLKLANLWANLVSREPPELPRRIRNMATD